MSLVGLHRGEIDGVACVYLAGLAAVGIGMEQERTTNIDERAWPVWLTEANGSSTSIWAKNKIYCMTSFC